MASVRGSGGPVPVHMAAAAAAARRCLRRVPLVLKHHLYSLFVSPLICRGGIVKEDKSVIALPDASEASGSPIANAKSRALGSSPRQPANVAKDQNRNKAFRGMRLSTK
uniref:Uncharacterized protein n=1 Tax=Oryza barthii TaxID=65489 RepID=A0A2I4S659_9ORYZ|nr:hypothetical protein BAR_14 [Oryza barthii]